MEDATKRALEDRAALIARAQRKTTAEKLFDMTEPRGRPYLAALVCQLLGAFEQDTFLSFLEDYDGPAKLTRRRSHPLVVARRV